MSYSSFNDPNPSPGNPPILAASCGEIGMTLLARENRPVRFERYDQPAGRRHEQRIATQRLDHPSFSGPDSPFRFNALQESMYRRVMYGLREYSQEQLAGMNGAERAKIVRDHGKCERLVHRLKVETVHGPATRLINACFPHLRDKIGTKASDYLLKLPPGATLNKLRIEARTVAELLVTHRLLPRNFFSLQVTGLGLD